MHSYPFPMKPALHLHLPLMHAAFSSQFAHLSIAQVGPVYLTRHMQSYDLPFGTHFAPFLHGFGSHAPPAGFSLGKQNGRTGNFGGQSHLINFPVFVSPWHLPPLLQGFGLQGSFI